MAGEAGISGGDRGDATARGSTGGGGGAGGGRRGGRYYNNCGGARWRMEVGLIVGLEVRGSEGVAIVI